MLAALSILASVAASDCTTTKSSAESHQEGCRVTLPNGSKAARDSNQSNQSPAAETTAPSPEKNVSK